MKAAALGLIVAATFLSGTAHARGYYHDRHAHHVHGWQPWQNFANHRWTNEGKARRKAKIKKRRVAAKARAAARAKAKAAAVARAKLVAGSQKVAARFSPPVAAMKRALAAPAEATGAAIKSTVEAADTAIRTPFGVVIKTVVRLDVLSPKLIEFTKKVASACGPVKVISGLRNSGVPRTCHRTGNALDYQVADPKCAMQVANRERGIGHSNDYYGVAAKYGRGMPVHYHVSDCGREMGKRFAHGGGSKYRATRYAKRYKKRGTRYARA